MACQHGRENWEPCPECQTEGSIKTLRTLYEVTDGWEGNSYRRCYVWAFGTGEAIELAEKSPGRNQGSDVRNFKVRSLFTERSASFATKWDDNGWHQE